MLYIVVFVTHLIYNISNKSCFNLFYFYNIFFVNCNKDRAIFKKFFIYRLVIFIVSKNARTSITFININYLIIFLIRLFST